MYERLTVSQRPRVLLLGDSITEQSWDAGSLPTTTTTTQQEAEAAQAGGLGNGFGLGGGWGAQLAHWYRRKADVVNRGYSGYNSRWIRSILDGLLPVAPEGSHNEWSNTILATVFLGANDAVGNAEGQLVPVGEYKENLRAILCHLRRCSESVHIALITPPKVDSVLWPNRSIERVSEYADAVRALVAEEASGAVAGAPCRVHLVDLWAGDLCIETADLRDGLHLGFVGSNKVATGIMRMVRAEVPELCPEGDDACPLPSHFPHWSAFIDTAGDGSTVNVPQDPAKADAVGKAWSWH